MALEPGILSMKKRLGEVRPLLCSWLLMPGSFQAGMYAKAGIENGVDGVLLDMQHGMIGFRDMVDMVMTARAAGAYAIVRPPLDDYSMVSRALDSGAAGIVFPMINTADEARKLVEVAKFPPSGLRSWGGYLGHSQSGLSKQDYLAMANDLCSVFAMVETKQALDNIDEICAVEGLDGIFVGPNDLAISLTKGQSGDVRHPLVMAALEKIIASTQRSQLFAGIYTSDNEQIKQYSQMGFKLMPALSDASFIMQGVALIGDDLDGS